MEREREGDHCGIRQFALWTDFNEGENRLQGVERKGIPGIGWQMLRNRLCRPFYLCMWFSACDVVSNA